MNAPARPVTELPRTVPVGLARRTMRTVQRLRSSFVFGALLLLFVGLLLRCVQVQLIGGAAYRGLVADQSRSVSIAPLRGAILDRNGRALALSRPVRHVVVEAGGTFNPVTKNIDYAIEDVGRFALTLSDLLDGFPSAAEIRARIQSRRENGPIGKGGAAPLPIKRDLEDPRIIARLEEARILPSMRRGLIVLQGDRRELPNGSWAALVIGKAGADDLWRPIVGRDGVEKELDPFLRGSTTERKGPRDGRGRRFVTPRMVDARDDADGRTVWLSLDLVIQGYCEQAVAEAFAEWPCAGVVAIVLDPQNGDVLAMAQAAPAQVPGPDGKLVPFDRNLATQWTTEVGSTFKPFTALRALELGLVGPEEPFSLPHDRTFTLGRATKTVHDSHDGGEPHPGATIADVVAQSNNPDIAELAFRIGSAGMRRLIEDLRVEKSFPLGGYQGREWHGRVRWESIGALDHLTFGYGHTMTMTPLRLAASFCAFARDDACPVVPRMVLAVGGEAVPDTPLGTPLARSARNLELMRRALHMTVTEGTAKETVLSPRLDISGKTGTAKKPDAFPKDALGRDPYYSCSFVGYAPSDHPRLVCLVMAMEPRAKADGSKPYGGAVAGPAVRSILERSLLEYMQVPAKNAPAGVRAPTTPSSAGPTEAPIDAPPPAPSSVTPLSAQEEGR